MKAYRFFILTGSALTALLSFAMSASAQMTKENVLKDIRNTAGIYSVYPDVACVQTPAPDGYEPFYISHFGRHGSRWHTSYRTYERPLGRLRQGHEEGKLTPVGEEVYAIVKVLADDARGRYGELSPRGVREHRHIAERMYLSFPEVFSTDHGRVCRIEAFSSTVVRCVLSMAASNERLKELNPEIRIDRTSTQGMMETVFGRKECYSLTKELSARKSRMYRENCNPDRLLAALFTDYGFIPEKDRWEMLHDLYMLASGCMDVDYLGVDLFRYLTEDESFAVWEVKNTMMYLQSGPSEEFGARALSDAKPTLRHIVSEADKAISKGDISATLRYGHDQNLVPLAALMGIEGCNIVDADGKDLYESWCDFLITPMAANIQLIFFRSGSSDKILVKILHNEKEVGIEGEEPVSFPYYDWEDLRCRFLSAAGKN